MKLQNSFFKKSMSMQTIVILILAIIAIIFATGLIVSELLFWRGVFGTN